MPYVLSRFAAALLSLVFVSEARASDRFVLGTEFRNPQSLLVQVNGYSGETQQKRLSDDEPCAAAIGRFQKPEAVFLRGTGVLAVHPRLVLTNAHVVAKDGQIKQRTEFELPERNSFKSYRGTVVSVGTRHPDLGRVRTPIDWAIIVLDGDAPVTPLALGFPRFEQISRFNGQLRVISYSRFPETLPGSGEQFPVVSRGCTVHDLRHGLYVHDCSTLFGGSGAPILAKEDVGCTIFGLVVSGNNVLRMGYPDREAVPFNADTANFAVPADMFRDEFKRVLAGVNQGLPASKIIKKAD